MGVVVRRYIDILTIIINFSYSTCISSFFGSSIPTSLFIFKMFFRSYTVVVPRVCVCVCVSVRSFLPPCASRPRNIGTYVFTATRKTTTNYS